MNNTYYPLTSSQELMYTQLRFSPLKSVTNISSVMHFDCDIDAVTMQQALYLGLCRNKASYIRIHKVKGKNMQYFTDKSPEQITVYDFSDCGESEFNEAIDKWSKTPFPNTSHDVQLYRVRFVKKPDGKYCVSFVVSHLAFDAYSLMNMASDILKCYKALVSGEPIPLSNTDPSLVFEEEQAYPDSEKKRNDLNWYVEMYKKEGEPFYTNILPRTSKVYHKNGRTGEFTSLIHVNGTHYNRRLSLERVNKVNSLAEKHGVSPQSVYLLALRSGLLKHSPYSDDCTILITTARRATLKQKRSMGTRVLGIQARYKFSNALSIGKALKVTQKRTLAYYKHVNLPVLDVANVYTKMFHRALTAGYYSLNLTYQPYSVPEIPSLPVHFTVHSNGGCSTPIYLTIMALDNSGELSFMYDHRTDLYTDEILSEFHEYIERFIDAAYENDALSVSELMEI